MTTETEGGVTAFWYISFWERVTDDDINNNDNDNVRSLLSHSSFACQIKKNLGNSKGLCDFVPLNFREWYRNVKF